MAETRYNIGSNPTIKFSHCGGSVAVEGYDGDEIVLISDEMQGLHQRDDTLTIDVSDDDTLLRVPRGAILQFDAVSGDLTVADIATLRVQHLDGDFSGRNLQSLHLDAASGDVSLSEIGTVAMRHADGNVAGRNLGTVSIDAVSGDLSLTDVGDVAVRHVDGDLKLQGGTGAITIAAVNGDASLSGDLLKAGPMHINGDLKLRTNWAADSDYRFTVNGDARIEIADDANLTLSATVGGDVKGLAGERGHGNVVSATWGDGSSRLELTVHGDLQVRGGAATQERAAGGWGSNFGTGDWGKGEDWRNAINDFTSELSAMGREFAAQFNELGREWRDNRGEQTAERARHVADRATERAAAAAERIRVRFNDREVRLDPERIERIKEQAQRAAEEGIARAQEAIERALRGFDFGGGPRPPAPPRGPVPPVPPMPPRGPVPPVPPVSPANMKQRINIMDDDGSSSINTPTTGPTIKFDSNPGFPGSNFQINPESAAPESNVQVNAESAAPETPASAADRTQERLAILKMVQAGKISADEAALLLEALS